MLYGNDDIKVDGEDYAIALRNLEQNMVMMRISKR